MKAYNISLINAILLIALSLWSYFDSESPSPTAFIPTVIGVALLICYPGVKKENKVVAHIAVVLTLLILVGLIGPLMGTISRSNVVGTIRVSIMLFSSLIAMIFFVRSFIEARRRRTED